MLHDLEEVTRKYGRVVSLRVALPGDTFLCHPLSHVCDDPELLTRIGYHGHQPHVSLCERVVQSSHYIRYPPPSFKSQVPMSFTMNPLDQSNCTRNVSSGMCSL